MLTENDIVLISNSSEEMQSSINCVNSTVGIPLDSKKINILRINKADNESIILNNQKLKNADRLRYLWTIFYITGGTDKDTDRRLSQLWSFFQRSRATKLKVFSTIVKILFLYG